MAKQLKNELDRIRYYVIKAAQNSSILVQKRKPNSIRIQRLMAYKKAISRSLLVVGVV
ncbi:hypothetical protein [Paenibacillus sp. sgz302251]|uniref:hypothetical protein n=1 Tax=Paenibacillus sp. sgz302251 TaxID=3414493 RepID=UPI003C7BC857